MADWINELANTEQLTEAKANARAVEAVAAGIRIQAEGPEFLRLLGMELREIARKLAEKPNLHVSVSITDDSEPAVENRFHVHIMSNAGWPEMTYTNIFNRIGETAIRCHTAEGTTYKLNFAARSSDGPVGVYVENGNGTVMTPAQVAQYIVEPMVKRVRSNTD